MPKKETKQKKEKVEQVQKKVKEINLEDIKKELYIYTDETIRKYYLQEIEKVNKVLIREKNKKILFRNFIITLLLLVIVFLVYLLNSVGYFSNNNIVNNNEIITKKKEVKPTEEPTVEGKKELTLDELKEKYTYLLDDVTINEKSHYIKDYYQGNITNELKNYIALNIVDLKKLDDMDEYNMFSDAILKAAYETIFNDTYKSVTFDYNGNQVRYINKLNSYITNSLLKKTESNIKREIIDIKVAEDKVSITTIEGIVKDDKLYNVIENKEISEYKKDSLINYQERLNKLTYTFENEKLTAIE